MDSKKLTKLKIYKKENFCGYLRRLPDGGAEFIYDSAYLLNEKAADLCVNMKKRSEPYIQNGTNLHPYFAGLLPEGLRLKYLLQKVKTSPDDLFSLFAAIGSDSIGDVYAQTKDEQYPLEVSAVPAWNEINFYKSL